MLGLSEGIWVDFIPGQKLAFAFVDEASVWAWSAGASSLTAGLLALTASMKWQALNYQTKQAFCALTFLSAGICLVALVLAGGEQPVYGFTIDLQHGISDGVLGAGTTIPTISVMQVTTRTDQHRCPSMFGHRHYYGPNYCYDTVSTITNGRGQSINLMSLNNYQTVYTINNLVLTFLNSQGQEE